MKDTQEHELLDALKFELNFHEHGGYDPSVREARRELATFRDSPSCLNFALEQRVHPCSECWLMDLVPAEKRGESVPCHHIRLNAQGDTVASLGGPGDAPEVHDAVCEWLRRTIHHMEEMSIFSGAVRPSSNRSARCAKWR